MDSNHQPAGFKPKDGFKPDESDAPAPLMPAAIVTIEPSIEDTPERDQPAIVTTLRRPAA